MSSATLALARANLRYWLTVAPIVRVELARWEGRAANIQDPQRRLLALDKLRGERLNPQLAATLATLAPRARRGETTEAIVALQVAYDYLDVLGEQTPRELESRDESLLDAFGLDGRPGGDDGYLNELTSAVRDRLRRLPAAPVVRETAIRAAERCGQAQMRGHEARGPGDEQLRRWASAQAQGASLGWPEWLAGAQASVLSLHALIAAAADPRTSSAEAQALDRAYLRIGALSMLDSLIDREEDRARGALQYAQLYAGYEQMAQRLAAVAREAVEETRALRDSSHHLVILNGLVAYYASAPTAREPYSADVIATVRSELGASLRPPLAVMRMWRAAKSVDCVFRRLAWRRE